MKDSAAGSGGTQYLHDSRPSEINHRCLKQGARRRVRWLRGLFLCFLCLVRLPGRRLCEGWRFTVCVTTPMLAHKLPGGESDVYHAWQNLADLVAKVTFLHSCC